MHANRTGATGHARDWARWTRWRAQRLRRAGFSGELADCIARESQVDVHAVLELVDRGCPPELAARILAPLDPDDGAHEQLR